MQHPGEKALNDALDATMPGRPSESRQRFAAAEVDWFNFKEELLESGISKVGMSLLPAKGAFLAGWMAGQMALEKQNNGG